jgi:hypothetical protein
MMGGFGIGASGSKQRSGLEVRQLPGLFQTNEPAQQVARRLGLEGRGDVGNIQEIFGLAAADVIGAGLTPREQAPFGPQTQAQQDLLNSLMDVTGGRTAARGLGAPTQTALAQTVAPTLLELREKEQGRLVQEQQLQQQQQALQLQSLLELAGISMPQIIAGQEGSARQFGLEIGGTFAKKGGGK